jgi:hypothetical protein
MVRPLLSVMVHAVIAVPLCSFVMRLVKFTSWAGGGLQPRESFFYCWYERGSDPKARCSMVFHRVGLSIREEYLNLRWK